MTALFTLDLATNTGFAFWRPGESRPVSGWFRMPKTGEDIGWFLDAFDKELLPLLTFHKPTHCVFEAPFVAGGKDKKGKPTGNLHTALKLLNLTGHTELVCRRAGIVCWKAIQSSAKKHFLGHGGLPTEEAKRRCMAKCREIGWDPANDDEADALALMDYSAHLLKLEVPWGVGGLWQAEGAA